MLDAVQREVEEHDARFVLHVGDVSYGDGKGEVWQQFMHDISPVASRVPYMIAVGNHDYDYHKGKHHRDPSGVPVKELPKWTRHSSDSNGECGVALATRFRMPQHGCAPRAVRAARALCSVRGVCRVRRAAAVQGVRAAGERAVLVQLRPRLGALCGGLVGALAEAQQRSVEVACGAPRGRRPLPHAVARPRDPPTDVRDPPPHREPQGAPPRCVLCRTVLRSGNTTPGHGRRVTGVDAWGDAAASRRWAALSPEHACVSAVQIAKHLRHHVEDLLLKYGVDVVVSGHVHSHSRSCPVSDKDCVAFCGGSVLHVITGSGGHKLSKISHHQPGWVDYAHRSWGYSRFTVRACPASRTPPLQLWWLCTAWRRSTLVREALPERRSATAATRAD